MSTMGKRSFLSALRDTITREDPTARHPRSALGSETVLGLYSAGFLMLACFFVLEILVSAWVAALGVTLFVAIIAVALTRFGTKHPSR